MTKREQLEEKVKEMTKTHGRNDYKIIECLACGNEFVGGTTGKRCDDCSLENSKKRMTGLSKSKIAIKNNAVERKCFFCSKTENTQIHHIDKDKLNNDISNLLILCKGCHLKLHGKIYNPLLKRVFAILTEERFSYEEIGEMFGTTRQNVYKLLKTK